MVSEHLDIFFFFSLNRKKFISTNIVVRLHMHDVLMQLIVIKRLVVSVSDDCFIRLWKLSNDEENLEVDDICFEHDKVF